MNNGKMLLPPNTKRRGEGGLRTKGLSKTSHDQKPLVSIITPVLNAVRYLEASIQSVLQQDYENIEYIIIDGNSTDGTLDILRRYSDTIDYWVSEPDTGIFSAMNKGIDLARGDWLYFLGADDRMADVTVVSDVSVFLDDSRDIVYGTVKFWNGTVFKSWVSVRTLMHNTIHHQSTFYHNRNFDRFRYDEGLQLVSDYELNLAAYLHRSRISRVDRIIALCSHRGRSRTQVSRACREINTIRRRYLNPVLSVLFEACFYIYCRWKYPDSM